MDERTRALVGASAALALGGAGIERALHRASAAADPDEVEEVLLQSYLFLGYPAALNGFAVWRRVSGRPAPASAGGDEAEWEARGAATFARVYGRQAPRLLENAAALHPDMQRWMVTEGYGKVLGRPQLDLVTRELCIVALLAPQDAAPQLYSHLRGALNAGAAEELVAETVQYVKAMLSQPRAAVLMEQWNAVRVRRAGMGES